MFKPLYDRVVVKRNEAEAVSPGGIVMLEESKEIPTEGIVLAVGEGKIDVNGNKIPMTVKFGDRIMLGKYSGTDVVIDGESLVIIREEEIIGILEN